MAPCHPLFGITSVNHRRLASQWIQILFSALVGSSWVSLGSDCSPLCLNVLISELGEGGAGLFAIWHFCHKVVMMIIWFIELLPCQQRGLSLDQADLSISLGSGGDTGIASTGKCNLTTRSAVRRVWKKRREAGNAWRSWKHSLPVRGVDCLGQEFTYQEVRYKILQFL